LRVVIRRVRSRGVVG